MYVYDFFKSLSLLRKEKMPDINEIPNEEVFIFGSYPIEELDNYLIVNNTAINYLKNNSDDKVYIRENVFLKYDINKKVFILGNDENYTFLKEAKTVPADLPDYIRQHDIVRAALRVAKEVDATDEEWKAFMEMLQNRQN